jgi:hypothetical protein
MYGGLSYVPKNVMLALCKNSPNHRW